ncbi:MAG: LCP family protein [Actinomycetota bacterium]
MTNGPLPGSRSERHESRRARKRRADAVAASARPMTPVIEALQPDPARTVRRAEQRGGRRRRRRRILAALLAVAALVAATLGATTYRRHHDKSSAPAAVKSRTQRTLLLQIPGPDNEANASALFVTDPAGGAASMILVPSRVLSHVPGYGSGVFGDALKLGGMQLSKDTLTNQLGVIVDDTWLLPQAALAAFVDSVGGVDVTVDVELPGGPESSGVALLQGPQHLDGPSAAAYATYGVAREPELGRLTRLQVVLAGVLDKLPKTVAGITPLLPAADASSSSPKILAESLSSLAQAKAAQKLSYKAVPVIDIDNGSDEETTRIDSDQLAAIVASDLAGSVPPNAFRPDNRVVVYNGVGTAGLGQIVTRRLNVAGFNVVQTGNATSFDNSPSRVTVFQQSVRATSEGAAVAAALGLPDDAVEVSDTEQDVADVIVTVGADFVASVSTGTSSPSVGP